MWLRRLYVLWLSLAFFSSLAIFYVYKVRTHKFCQAKCRFRFEKLSDFNMRIKFIRINDHVMKPHHMMDPQFKLVVENSSLSIFSLCQINPRCSFSLPINEPFSGPFTTISLKFHECAKRWRNAFDCATSDSYLDCAAKLHFHTTNYVKNLIDVDSRSLCIE